MAVNHVITSSRVSRRELERVRRSSLLARPRKFNTMGRHRANLSFALKFGPTSVKVSLLLLGLVVITSLATGQPNPGTRSSPTSLHTSKISDPTSRESRNLHQFHEIRSSVSAEAAAAQATYNDTYNENENDDDDATATQFLTNFQREHANSKQRKSIIKTNKNVIGTSSEGREPETKLMIDSADINHKNDQHDAAATTTSTTSDHLHRAANRKPQLGEQSIAGLSLPANETQGQQSTTSNNAEGAGQLGAPVTAAGAGNGEQFEQRAVGVTTGQGIDNSNNSGIEKRLSSLSPLRRGDNEISENANQAERSGSKLESESESNSRWAKTGADTTSHLRKRRRRRRSASAISSGSEESTSAGQSAAAWIEDGDKEDQDGTSELVCRIEKNEYMDFWEYKHYACAHCYDLIPSIMFTRKLIHNREQRTHLRDEHNNRSILPNQRELIKSTFRHDEIYSKWIDCCRLAVSCCKENFKYLPTTRDETGKLVDKTDVCPGTWDGLTCWPDTQPGTQQTKDCMSHVYNQDFEPDCKGSVSKECFANASWYIRGNHEWSNYKTCNTANIYFIRLLTGSLWLFASGVVATAPALLILERMPRRGSGKRVQILRNILLWLLICSILSIAHRTGVMMRLFTRDTHPSRVAKPPSQRELMLNAAVVSVSTPPPPPPGSGSGPSASLVANLSTIGTDDERFARRESVDRSTDITKARQVAESESYEDNYNDQRDEVSQSAGLAALLTESQSAFGNNKAKDNSVPLPSSSPLIMQMTTAHLTDTRERDWQLAAAAAASARRKREAKIETDKCDNYTNQIAVSGPDMDIKDNRHDDLETEPAQGATGSGSLVGSAGGRKFQANDDNLIRSAAASSGQPKSQDRQSMVDKSQQRLWRPTTTFTELTLDDVTMLTKTDSALIGCSQCLRLKRSAMRDSVSSNAQQQSSPISRIACWVITVLGRTARLMCYAWMFTGAVYLCSILHWAPAEPPARFVRFLLRGTTIFPITIEIIYIALRTVYDTSPLNLLIQLPYYYYHNDTAYVDYLWASQLECWFEPSPYSFIESIEDYANLILVTANVFLFLITLLIMCRMERPGCTRQGMNVWDYFKAAGTLVSLYGTHYALFAYRPYFDSNCVLNQLTYYCLVWFDGCQGAVVAIVFCYKTDEGKEIVRKWLRNKTVFGSLYKSTCSRSNDAANLTLHGTSNHSFRSNNSNGTNRSPNEMATEMIHINEDPLPIRS